MSRVSETSTNPTAVASSSERLLACLGWSFGDFDACPGGDRCEQYSYAHYHFPYAHDDWHRYDGSHFHYDNTHQHHYSNTTHNTLYEKRC